jgi:hypothetical protein
MEVRAAALKRQAKSAERYRKLTDQIRTAEARLIFARWREAAIAADAAKKEAEAQWRPWNVRPKRSGAAQRTRPTPPGRSRTDARLRKLPATPPPRLVTGLPL